jgi:hypothetical protein
MNKSNPLKTFTAAMSLYVVLLVAVVLVVREGLVPGWEVPLSLLPLIPGIFVVISILGSFRQMDEMQRRIQLEAFGLAYAGLFLLLLTETLLGITGSEPSKPGTYIMYMGALWIIGLGLAQRKYR